MSIKVYRILQQKGGDGADEGKVLAGASLSHAVALQFGPPVRYRAAIRALKFAGQRRSRYMSKAGHILSVPAEKGALSINSHGLAPPHSMESE